MADKKKKPPANKKSAASKPLTAKSLGTGMAGKAASAIQKRHQRLRDI